MAYIMDILRRAKETKQKNISIKYLERDSKRSKEIKLDDVKKVEEIFLVIQKKDEEIYVPTHMIREVRAGKKILWSS